MKKATKSFRPGASLAAAALAALAAGCTSDFAVIGPFPTTTQGNPWIGAPAPVSAPAQAAPAVAPADGAAAAPLPVKSFPCTRLESAVRVHVDVRALPYASDIAERALSGLRDTLSRRGFMLDWDAASGKEDVLVSVRADRRVADRFGEFETHEADVRATVTVPSLEGKVLGDEMFHAEGIRALGEAAADRALAEAAVPRLSAWMERTITPETIGVATETYAVAYGIDDPEGNQGHARALLARAASLDGVLEARIVSQDDWRGTVAFRFVYLAEKFPDGLVNAIVLTDPQLQYTPSEPAPKVAW